MTEDVTNSPKDWEDFWYNEDAKGDDIVVNMDGGVVGLVGIVRETCIMVNSS